MTPKNIILAVGGSIIIALLVIYFISSDEEDAIKALFDQVAEIVSKETGETAIGGMAKIKSLREFFVEPCRVDAPAYQLDRAMGFDEIAAFVFKERASYEQITMKFHRFLIEFKNKKEAMVDVTAGFAGKTADGGLTEDVHQLSCRLIKTGDQWLIERIQVVEEINTLYND